VLVVAQLAVGCVMATAAILLVRSLSNVQHVDVGFDSAQRIAARVSLSDQRYTPEQVIAFYRQLQQALELNPQIQSVGFESNAVLEIIRTTRQFAVARADQPISARVDSVSGDYFRTLGLPVLAGRPFDEHDTAESEPVVIVNQTFASRLGGDAVGRVLRATGSVGHPGKAARIVGIVRDAQYNGITEAPQPFVYLPVTQSSAADLYVYIHSTLAPAQAIMLLRSEVRRLNPEVPLTDVGPLGDRVTAAQIVPRSTAIASTTFATIAVFLALVGVYAVMTTSIENRRREFAIRSALGASPSFLVRRVLRETATLTLIACAIGVAGSLAAARAVAGLLFGVRPHDPASLVGAAGLILVASALACVAPARRAATVDPIDALRAE
jgi:predicted permease